MRCTGQPPRASIDTKVFSARTGFTEGGNLLVRALASPGISMAQEELPPILETASGQQVTVFETANPNIVVVWSF